MSKVLDEKIEQYYKLKQKYDNSVRKPKLIIINDYSLSSKEKRQRIALVKNKCVNCKKDGGTIFSNKDGRLTAVCGHVEKPCSLNININRGDYEDIRRIHADLSNEVSNIRKQIITTKLDMLFGYIDEKTALDNFDKLKKELKLLSKPLEKQDNIYNNIINNPERNKKIIELEVKIHEIKQEINKIIKEYKVEKKTIYINDAIEAYINKLVPLIKELQSVKYKSMYIENDTVNGTNVLIQEVYTLNELIINLES